MEQKTRINPELAFSEISVLLNKVHDQEHDHIKAAADIAAKTIANGGVVHVFGSGHSFGFGLEMKDRPGALAPIHNISSADLVIYGSTTVEEYRAPDNHFERRAGIADELFDLYKVDNKDSFIIISNSGINGLVIDMAAKAKENGLPVVIVTSMEHTLAEASRHPSGKKLYEFGDVVIDNCGPRGDALLETGRLEKVCSVSSITGAMIAHGVAVNAIEILEEMGIEPPVWKNNDTEENIAYNKALKAKYQGRV